MGKFKDFVKTHKLEFIVSGANGLAATLATGIYRRIFFKNILNIDSDIFVKSAASG